MATETLTVTAFREEMLRLIDRLAAHKLDRIVLTRHGKVVAEVLPAREESPFEKVYGSMKGSVVAPKGYDFTGPIFDDASNAELGKLLDADPPAPD